MSGTYFLRLRGRNVLGSVQLDVRTLSAAKSLALEWAKNLKGGTWSVEVTNEKGETQWVE